MKQRLITAGVGVVLVIALCWFHQTFLFNLSLCIVSGVIIYEILNASNIIKNRPVSIVAVLFSAVFMLIIDSSFKDLLLPLTFGYIIIIFALLVVTFNTISFADVATTIMSSICVPLSLSTLQLVGKLTIYNNGTIKIDGIVYILMILIGAWITDTGAYLVGTFWGKTKLIPQVSPNKTKEGAVGGIILSMLCFLLLGLLFQKYMAHYGINIYVSYIGLAVVGLISSIMGILGDVVASTIKRQYSVKDFGYIMPGHGGLLDRFDSILFVAPFIYFMLERVVIFAVL